MAYASWSVVANEQPSASKWNILGTNDAYFDSLIGSGTAWTAFTPVWTNLTVGNGTNASYYQQIGKTVSVTVSFKLGTTSSVSSNPYFALPVAASSHYTTTLNYPLGLSWVVAGGTGYINVIGLNSATTGTAQLISILASGTYALASGSTSTVPGTWTTNDYITANLKYESV
jgi:hypothetical protein